MTFHPDAESLVRVCDVVTINAPLHPETEHLFDDALIAQDEARRVHRQHRARQDLRPRCDRAGAGERPARRLCRRRLVPAARPAGSPLADDAPPRDDAARVGHVACPRRPATRPGAREILECWFDGRPIREEYLIVDRGKLAGAGAHSYSAGDATGGSEEAARFKGS